MTRLDVRGPVWSNGTVPEGSLLGRLVGGILKPLSVAEVAGLLSAPSSSTIGNLLTANQATPATGQLTLSGATEASGLVLTASGSGAYTALVSGVAVTVGQVYTVSASLAPTGRTAAVRISWRNAGGSEISAVAGDTIAVGATGTSMAVGVAPAGAVTMYAYAAYASTGSAGDAVTVTRFGAWAGAGGIWSAPGVPITGTGRRVSHPGTDAVLVEVWDATQGRWQMAHYDSGLRGVSGLLVNGWSAPAFTPLLRRTNYRVELMFGYRLDGSSATSDVALTIPAGFLVSSPVGSYMELGALLANSNSGLPGRTYADLVPAGLSVGIPAGATSASVVIPSRNLALTGRLAWDTNDAIPTSLPGTLVSSAPYA